MIKGTRMTVEGILWKIAGGFTFAEILEMHPHLMHEDMLAAVMYAATVVGSEEMV